MKHLITTIVISCGLLASAHAAITLPGNNHGTDGELVIPGTADPSTYVIDLSQAVSGTWDDDNTANQVAGLGPGIYDPQKWAVVFKYSRVEIGQNVTVSFTNHPSRAPVVWLVDGSVTISGTVSVDGQNSVRSPALAEPGPGGFRGGSGYLNGLGAGAGFGPGGSKNRSDGLPLGASHGGTDPENSSYSAPTYGNPSLIPLIGGSGGIGHYTTQPSGGGAGGGAILIAAIGEVTLDGGIRARGGSTLGASQHTAAGSGGGIRIICDTLTGGGDLSALGGVGTYSSANGGVGRVRLEYVSRSSGATVAPDPSVVTLTAGSEALLWPPTTAPKVEVYRIGGLDSPSDPRAGLGVGGPDLTLTQDSLDQDNKIRVIVRTTNVEDAAEVFVRLTPRNRRTNPGYYLEIQAVKTATISTNPDVFEWTADIPADAGYSAVQARVLRP